MQEKKKTSQGNEVETYFMQNLRNMIRMKHLVSGHMWWLKGKLETVASTRQIIVTLVSFLKTVFLAQDCSL